MLFWKSQSRSENETISNSQETLEALDILLSRYRRVLSLVAYRVLGNHEEAEEGRAELLADSRR